MSDLTLEPKAATSMRRLRIAEANRAIEMGIHDNNAPDFFHALVRNLALILRVEHALVSELLGEKKWRVRTLGLSVSDHFGEDYTYSLEDTPCAKVMKGTACYFPTHIEIFLNSFGRFCQQPTGRWFHIILHVSPEENWYGFKKRKRKRNRSGVDPFLQLFNFGLQPLHLGCQRADLLFQKPILFRQCKQDSFDRQKFCFSSRL